MKSTLRIASILNADYLKSQITGFSTFRLSELNLPNNLKFELPTNVRLGHIAENVVSQSIKYSTNFNLLYENIQVIEEHKTIGEIDFVIENIDTKQIIHMELAYKFYLYDPTISSKPLRSWIGPNRNDSLSQKLAKLKSKQFPLLYHTEARKRLDFINIDTVSQALCFLVSLYVPYEYKGKLEANFKESIKGYYINWKTFIRMDRSDKSYCLPPRKQWGIEASKNKFWSDLSSLRDQITSSINEKQALLCWQKQDDFFSEFFIVWW